MFEWKSQSSNRENEYTLQIRTDDRGMLKIVERICQSLVDASKVKRDDSKFLRVPNDVKNRG